jgi:sigma-B regulation protein RsbQ
MPYVQTVFYECKGKGSPALLFVHGWLGSSAWWVAQEMYFADRFTVLRMDLPGHGRSAPPSDEWTSGGYADAICAVIDDAGGPEVVLVGHSMAGAYALEASLIAPQVQAVVLVDTLKNLDGLMNYEQADRMLLSRYREDFRSTVETFLPGFLFSPTTPTDVRERLLNEFLTVEPGRAVHALEPLYRMDVRSVAERVGVPVRGIHSNFTPTNVEANRRVFANYDFIEIPDAGHYPMLERSEAFNQALTRVLESLTF